MSLVLIMIGSGIIGLLNAHYNIPLFWGGVHSFLWVITILAIKAVIVEAVNEEKE